MEHIKILKNTNPDFYKLVGWSLGNRLISNDLGGQLWNTDNKIWFVYMKDEQVIGFCTLEVFSAFNKFANMYVKPEFRNKGYGAKLFNFRENYNTRHFKNKKIKTVVRCTSKIDYSNFTLIKTTKQFHFYERN